MAKQLWNKGRVALAGRCAVLALGLMALSGCGNKGYQDIAAQQSAAANAAVTTTGAPAVIDAATLKQWMDEGKLNAPLGTPDRVALVTVSSMKNYTTAGKKKLHIPGAGFFSADTELYATREEGLGPVGSMVPTGAQMDTVVKKLGIDDKTTIVITIPKGSADGDHYPQSRAYFTFRYWGFDRNRIKILNGGDDAWDVASAADSVAYPALVKTDTVINSSTYSVANNRAGLKDVLRYSLSEMIATVDALIADSSLLSTWQMVEARGLATTPYITNALRTQDLNPKAWPAATHALMFLEDRVNNDPFRNRLYPDKTTLKTRMESYNLKAGTADALLSPSKKTIVMCGSAISASPSFVLFDAVLAVPEGQIMMYDGSSSQWNGYSVARIAAANPTATPAQISAWAFDSRVQGTLPTTGSLATLLTGFALYSPTNPLMNQIEKADRAYMNTSNGSGTSSSTVGSAGGGC
jgi:3-mercaptopyruvate sulfurtransferase SseA